MALGWIISIVIAVVTALATIIWYFVRQFANRIVERLDKMVEQNEHFGLELVRISESHNSLEFRVTNNEKRLNDHADRIRDMEIKQAGAQQKTRSK